MEVSTASDMKVSTMSNKIYPVLVRKFRKHSEFVGRRKSGRMKQTVTQYECLVAKRNRRNVLNLQNRQLFPSPLESNVFFVSESNAFAVPEGLFSLFITHPGSFSFWALNSRPPLSELFKSNLGMPGVQKIRATTINCNTLVSVFIFVIVLQMVWLGLFKSNLNRQELQTN